MGDFIFLIKMLIFTFVAIVLMQVKVGPTTIESKVEEWTHRSELGQDLQIIGQSLAQFIGIQYRKFRSGVNSPYLERNGEDQIPGQRLRAKLKKYKKKAKSKVKKISDQIESREASQLGENLEDYEWSP